MSRARGREGEGEKGRGGEGRESEGGRERGRKRNTYTFSSCFISVLQTCSNLLNHFIKNILTVILTWKEFFFKKLLKIKMTIIFIFFFKKIRLKKPNKQKGN